MSDDKDKKIEQEVFRLFRKNSFPNKSDRLNYFNYIDTFTPINEKLPVLSISNVNAYLIALGIKDIENRSWNSKQRGTVLIHASGKEINFEDSVDFLPHKLSAQKQLDLIEDCNEAYSFIDYVIDNKKDFFEDGMLEEIDAQLAVSDLNFKLNNAMRLYLFFCVELETPVSLTTYDYFRWNAFFTDVPTWTYNTKKEKLIIGTQSIIGQVDIMDCKKETKGRWGGNEGDYKFSLDNAILYEKPKLDVKGKLGFWKLNS